MTERHLLSNGPLRAWRVERAPGGPVLTQAGRVAIPVRLRRFGRRLFSTDAKLVLTAEDADALCTALKALLHPDGGQEAAS
ncbi:hypothetical protein [Actinacidiphila rubida]|uniref:hypothetical protein n=1 Tax=Actinacidiphila rubida TaxID=310780 RepID=UPI00114D16C6|nr:hypothetical protein [Actinacidiphila rubida]